MTGMFYYCLCNIDPSLRSRLQSIMLLAAVEISVMEKYGIDKVLEPFVEEMKQLEYTENHGITPPKTTLLPAVK